MGRRSVHTPEELRQLILGASRGIIERDGLAGLSAREVARLIGYSAGTLYNIFDNLDDILMTLQAQLLSEVSDAIKSVPKVSDRNTYILNVAKTYVDFALANPRLWNLLFAHTVAPNIAAQSVLQEHMMNIVKIVAEPMQHLAPQLSIEDIEKNTAILIASIHGITAIAVTSKARKLTTESAQDYACNLTKIFIRGLQAL